MARIVTYLINVPGVFHIHMAIVDAIWRTHIRDKNVCMNEGGTFELFKTLHPQDSSKLASNPRYCMLNDGIQHLIRAHLMVCWEQMTGVSDLKVYAEIEPSWDEIGAFSR